MPLVGSDQLLWYQAPAKRVMDNPVMLENYQRLLLLVAQRRIMFEDLRCEHVFCDVTDTINFAGHPMLLMNMEEDFRVAGFDQKELSGDAMDQQEREEFRKMILSGGTYSG